MSRADELRAELELLDLEAKFVAAKKSGKATPELRAGLREARRAFRLQREGSAAVATEPIAAKSSVNKSGA